MLCGVFPPASGEAEDETSTPQPGSQQHTHDPSIHGNRAAVGNPNRASRFLLKRPVATTTLFKTPRLRQLPAISYATWFLLKTTRGDDDPTQTQRLRQLQRNPTTRGRGMRAREAVVIPFFFPTLSRRGGGGDHLAQYQPTP